MDVSSACFGELFILRLGFGLQLKVRKLEVRVGPTLSKVPETAALSCQAIPAVPGVRGPANCTSLS